MESAWTIAAGIAVGILSGLMVSLAAVPPGRHTGIASMLGRLLFGFAVLAAAFVPLGWIMDTVRTRLGRELVLGAFLMGLLLMTVRLAVRIHRTSRSKRSADDPACVDDRIPTDRQPILATVCAAFEAAGIVIALLLLLWWTRSAPPEWLNVLPFPLGPIAFMSLVSASMLFSMGIMRVMVLSVASTMAPNLALREVVDSCDPLPVFDSLCRRIVLRQELARIKDRST
jgi:hypothetical protein